MTRRLNRELDPRVAWLLMMLYPRAWRDRYGAEVLRLTRELIAAGETSPARAAVDLAVAAVAERCRALGGSWRPALAMSVAALLAVTAAVYASGYSHRAARPSAALRPAALVPARASLTRIMCAFPSRTSVSVTATTARAGLVPAGPAFIISLPSGAKLTPIQGRQVPVVFARPGQGQNRLCVELPGRCHVSTGYAVTISPGHPVGRVTVKLAGCVPSPAQAGTSGP